MANETLDTEAPAADAAPKKKAPIAILLAAGVAAGAGVGTFLAGPVIAKRISPKSVAERDTIAPKDTATGPIHLIENLVLNPTGTGSTRFLLVTVGLQARTPADADLLKIFDAAIRDVILGELGIQSVETLADISKRAELKARVRESVDSLMKRPMVGAVYFPQFVLQ